MNRNEEYFASLISSHLNGNIPTFDSEIDFNELYRLATINNVSAIIYNELSKLSIDDRAKINNYSDFKQQFGYTLIDYEEKVRSVKVIKDLMDKENIDYIFVKGAVIRDYYPIKELRASADTDIIVRDSALEALKKLIKNENIEIETDQPDFISINIFSQNIEISSENRYDHEYFRDIFSLCTNKGNQFILDDYNHLIYILCHIIKHFRYWGAGIKMFMDIDVMIRHIDNFDYNRVMELAKKLDIEMFAKSALSLCRYMFRTPVKAEIDFDNKNDFRRLFEEEIINSGAFGFSKRDLGSHYIIGSSHNGKVSRIRAFISLLFPSSNYLKNCFEYTKKHPILLPIAWLHRLFIAVFKRGSHSIATISAIADSKDNSDYVKLLNELNIEK